MSEVAQDVSIATGEGGGSTHHMVGGATAPQDRFEAVDSLRGVCALLVALHHFSLFTNSNLWSLGFVRNAYLFVDFFFVLSGFVVCHAYGTRIRAPGGMLNFMIRRFGRLWPLHIAVLGLLLGFIALAQILPHPAFMNLVIGKGTSFSLGKLVFSAAFLGAHHIAEMGWNAPSWSISAEFTIYAVFGVVCLAPRKLLLPISALIIVAGLTTLALKSKYYINTTSEFGLARCALGFFIGVVTYVLYRFIRDRAQWGSIAATLIEAAAILAALAFVGFVASGPFEQAPLTLIAPIVFALVVLVVALGRGRITKALTIKPFLWLGELSYSLYMLHWPIFLVTSYIVYLVSTGLLKHDPFVYRTDGYPDHTLTFSNGLQADGLALLMVVTTVAVSALTYRQIEAPGRSYFNGIAKKLDKKANPV